MTSMELCVSHGGSEGSEAAADDDGRTGPFETGSLCAGEEDTTDGNKTSETTCQTPKKEKPICLSRK